MITAISGPLLLIVLVIGSILLGGFVCLILAFMLIEKLEKRWGCGGGVK